MRWALLGAVVAVGCQHVDPQAGGLGGGVIPASYALRQAPAGTGPAVLTTPPARTFRRVVYCPRPARPEPVALGHGSDYRWIVGVLCQERGAWVVRYDSADAPDRHGGAMELLDTGPMTGFWPGAVVRVEGELVDPAPLEIRPAYRVRTLHLVGR